MFVTGLGIGHAIVYVTRVDTECMGDFVVETSTETT